MENFNVYIIRVHSFEEPHERPTRLSIPDWGYSIDVSMPGEDAEIVYKIVSQEVDGHFVLSEVIRDSYIPIGVCDLPSPEEGFHKDTIREYIKKADGRMINEISDAKVRVYASLSPTLEDLTEPSDIL